MNIVEFNKLTKMYGKERGIIEVDFSIKEGEIFGFIGPNGAGKSTAIRTLLNLLQPTMGSIDVFGKDSVDDYSSILADVGYLPAELFYYDNMRGEQLLKYSEKFYKKDCSAKRQELAKLFSVDLKQKISDMSFGTRKKIGIIDALQHEPKLLVLDEPTSGLDPLMQKKFFALLAAEKERKTTIFFSSHVLGEVQKICERAAIIKEGRIIKIENIKELEQQSVKRISFTSLKEVMVELIGISDFKQIDEQVSFLYRGKSKQLLDCLGKLDLDNLTIVEPDLEEVFLHYYE